MIGTFIASGLGIVVVTTGTQAAHAGVAMNWTDGFENYT